MISTYVFQIDGETGYGLSYFLYLVFSRAKAEEYEEDSWSAPAKELY